jgi:hypothetical protein
MAARTITILLRCVQGIVTKADLCRCASMVAVIFVAFATHQSSAGINVIGELQPQPQANVSAGIHGITFDTDSNPIILDRWAWTLQRVDKNTAAVLSSVTSKPVLSFSDQLVFDPSTMALFTRTYEDSGGDALVRIDPLTHDHVTVGLFGTPFINFGGMAIDASGTLWMGIDSSTESLWTVNKSTGAATFQRNITFPGGLQLHTMMIAADGTFYASAKALGFNDGGEGIYRINPSTGAATFLTSTNPPASAYALISMAQDPGTLRYYGIWQHLDFSESKYKFQLVEVTGIPEPSGLGLLLWVFGLALRRRPR